MPTLTTNVIPLSSASKVQRKPLTIQAGVKDLPDAQLLLLTAEGNEKAFEYYYARHEKRIYNKALAKCRDGGLAEQLVQDVFVKFYLRVKESEDPTRYQVSYLYSMLETAYIDHLRENQSFNEFSLNDEHYEGFDIQDDSHHAKPDKIAEQNDILKVMMKPLLNAEKLLNKSKGRAEKELALRAKKKIEEEVNETMETFDQLYRYGYSMQEMAKNLGLTLEQVKYRNKKLLEAVEAELRKVEISV